MFELLALPFGIVFFVLYVVYCLYFLYKEPRHKSENLKLIAELENRQHAISVKLLKSENDYLRMQLENIHNNKRIIRLEDDIEEHELDNGITYHTFREDN